jgi:hypothetical protein
MGVLKHFAVDRERHPFIDLVRGSSCASIAARRRGRDIGGRAA